MAISVNQEEFSRLFRQYDDKQISLEDLSAELRVNLLKLLGSEQLAGEQRNIIRDLFSSLDKTYYDYLSIKRVNSTNSEPVSEGELLEAHTNLTKVINSCRESLVTFFTRQGSLGSPKSGDTQPAQQTDQLFTNDKKLELENKITQNPDDSNAYNNLGNYYFNVKKDYNKAIELYKLAIDKNPSNYIYYSNIGDCFYSMQNYKESKHWYKQAVDRRPQDDITLNALANSHAGLGEYDEAINNYKKALKANAQAIYYVNLGDMYIRKKQYNEGLRSYQSALFVDERFTIALDAIADWYSNMYFIGNRADNSLIERAISYYKQSLAIEPNNVTNYDRLGEAYHYLKKYDEAIKVMQKAAELDKNNPRYPANIGYEYFWKRDFDKASEYYNKALDIKPDYDVALKYIAELNSQLKHYDEAIKNYNQILEEYPDSPDILRSLSEIYSLPETEFQNRDLTKSLEYAKRSVDVAPNEYESYYTIALVYKELDDLDNAKINLIKAIELNKNDPTLYTSLGSIYLEIPDYPEAVKQLQKAIDLEPENPVPYSYLALIYSKIHNWDKAIGYAETANKKAKAINPKDDKYVEYISRVYHDKGLDYYNQNKLDEAIEEYKKANAIRENAVTYYNLYLCYFYSEPKRIVEARKAIIKAIELSPRVNPDYTTALSKLG